MSNRMMTSFAMCLLLAGCGNAAPERTEPSPVKDTAFGDMVGTMDKARGVEATQMQHKDDVDRAIDDGSH